MRNRGGVTKDQTGGRGEGRLDGQFVNCPYIRAYAIRPYICFM